MDHDERKRLQREASDKHLADVEKAYRKASKTIRNSKREIQRSRDLQQELASGWTRPIPDGLSALIDQLETTARARRNIH
jgi:hypothetical protein